jgi:hypothetical protein
MDHTRTIDLLNRLFRVHYRSLPVYVQGTRPWTPPEQQKALELLAAVAADQKRTTGQIAEAIQQERGRLDPGQFPVAFTAIHDVSAQFLLQRAAELHRRDLKIIQECAAELAAVPSLRLLAEETLRQAQTHREMLGERMRDEG